MCREHRSAHRSAWKRAYDREPEIILLQPSLHIGVGTIGCTSNPVVPRVAVELVGKKMEAGGMIGIRAQIANIEHCTVVHEDTINIVPLHNDRFAANF